MTYHVGNHLIDPYILLEKGGVVEGMHIADFGCGRTGHVVFPASQQVGDRGVIYAVDILKDVLESVRKRAAIEAIHNVETVWADLGQERGLAIPERTLDLGFFINVLYHFDSYDVPLDEAARVLKEKGRIVVVDWTKKLSILGPSVEHMVRFDRVISWARAHSFAVQEDLLVGPYHRAVVLYRV
jgi:ubiquinone/menaquinone biosynthesis C-methylase UbiE